MGIILLSTTFFENVIYKNITVHIDTRGVFNLSCHTNSHRYEETFDVFKFKKLDLVYFENEFKLYLGSSQSGQMS